VIIENLKEEMTHKTFTNFLCTKINWNDYKHLTINKFYSESYEEIFKIYTIEEIIELKRT